MKGVKKLSYSKVRSLRKTFTDLTIPRMKCPQRHFKKFFVKKTRRKYLWLRDNGEKRYIQYHRSYPNACYMPALDHHSNI
jgi:hypothetical protein